MTLLFDLFLCWNLSRTCHAFPQRFSHNVAQPRSGITFDDDKPPWPRCPMVRGPRGGLDYCLHELSRHWIWARLGHAAALTKLLEVIDFTNFSRCARSQIALHNLLNISAR